MEGEELSTFTDVIETIEEVLDEPVELKVRGEDGGRSTVQTAGRLSSFGPHPDHPEELIYRVGQRTYLTLSPERFVQGHRSAIDAGSLWSIVIEQAGGLTLMPRTSTDPEADRRRPTRSPSRMT